ncbi:MAG: ECF transporter S component [Candidatus Bathyarchaeota archaeon]|nr:MAG: ECF transporter S component [Candidatus Bathyarchaeota archaeon]
MLKNSNRTKALTLAALMAALANILSIEALTIPLIIGPYTSKIHFTQLPIFISAALAGPLAGMLTGAIGGLYMSYSVGIPFIVGGLAILGFSAGILAHRLKLRPMLSSIFAWCIQAPYVAVTDYVWFVYSRLMPSSVAMTVITTILLNLTIEAIVASIIATTVIHYVKRRGLFQ